MRIYIACLASYNNGVLHGRWLDVSSNVDEMQEVINDILRASPYPNVMVECPACEGERVVPLPGSKGQVHNCPACNGRGEVPSAEEYAVHDYDAFPNMGEYPSLEDVAEYVDLVDACSGFSDDDVRAVVDACNGNLVTAREMLEDNYCGHYDSFRDYADEAADEMMACHEGVPECISNYFDYESWARDLKHDMTVVDVPTGVLVFHG